jgi:hypothetical protein
MPGLSDGSEPAAGTVDPMHVPDRRPGIIPVDDRRENRQQEDRTMTKARRPRMPSVEELAQLVVGVVNALARLLDAIHHHVH